MTPFFYLYEGVWGRKSSKNKMYAQYILTLYAQVSQGLCMHKVLRGFQCMHKVLTCYF